jgi:hypothetical protein
MKKRLLALAIVLAMVAAMIVPMAVSASAMYYVATTGNDATGNGSSGSPYATIAKAVSVAVSGDTINVAAGTYVTSSIGLSQGVTIDGPNAGVNPNTGSRSTEAIIQFTSGAQGFQPTTTAPVTIDGFTIEGPGMMLYTYVDGTNVTFQNDIITNVATGEGFFYSNPATLGFNNNKVTDATINGGNSDILFVAGNWNGSTGTVVTIENNVFDDGALSLGSQCDGMNLSNCSGTISGNTFENLAYYGILLANDCGETVSNNIFDNIQNPNPSGSASWGAGVRFYTPSGNGPVSITGNTFENSYVGIGVRPGDSIASMNVTIKNNTFGPGNNSNIVNSGSGAIDATYNSWGTTNATTIGASITGPGAPLVTYIPFNSPTPPPIISTNSSGTMPVTGTIVGPTISVTAPATYIWTLWKVGDNYGSDVQGSVSVVNLGSANSVNWQVVAQDLGTDYGFMRTTGNVALANKFEISKDDSNFYYADTPGITYTGNTLTTTTPLDFYGYQKVTNTDAAGTYQMTITFTATITSYN